MCAEQSKQGSLDGTDRERKCHDRKARRRHRGRVSLRQRCSTSSPSAKISARGGEPRDRWQDRSACQQYPTMRDEA